MAYRFDLLGIDVDGAHDREAWDRGEELRLFGLAPLPPGTFDRLVGILSSVEQRRWPVWLPGRTSPRLGLEQRLDREVRALLDAAGQPS